MRRAVDSLNRILFRAGLTDEEYKWVNAEVQGGNRQNLLIYSVIAGLFLFLMFAISFLIETARPNRLVYLGALAVSVGIFCVVKFASARPCLMLTSMYAFMGIMMAFGIMLGTVAQREERAVTFIALLLTVPLLFTDRPGRIILCIYASVAVFVVAALAVKEEKVFVADVINACVFGTISAIVSTYMMMVKFRRYLYEMKTRELSVTDLLTGLRNRNSFEQNLPQYAHRCKKALYCVYLDVNGLHEMNNAQGHEAGDRMLKYVAGALQEQFGREDSYRIGGDEFVAMAADADETAVQHKVDRMIAGRLSCVHRRRAGGRPADRRDGADEARRAADVRGQAPVLSAGEFRPQGADVKTGRSSRAGHAKVSFLRH